MALRGRKGYLGGEEGTGGTNKGSGDNARNRRMEIASVPDLRTLRVTYGPICGPWVAICGRLVRSAKKEKRDEAAYLGG